MSAVPALTRLRLAAGTWEGVLDAPGSGRPALRLRHCGDVVCEPEVTEAGSDIRGRWNIRFRLPIDRLSDGVHTFVIEDARSGRVLGHETFIAGEPAEDDLRAEIGQLRAELDLLKRAFRRHCVEG